MSVENNPIRVLFADDEKPLRTLFEACFSGLSRLQITLVEDGDQAVSELEKDPKPDILITDYNMPGHDGLAVIAFAKRVKPSIFTVLCTASDVEQIKQMDIKGHIDAFVQKPSILNPLSDIIMSRFKEHIDAAR